MNWYRMAGIVAVVGIVAVTIYLGFRPSPTVVDTAIVQSGPFRVAVEEEGKTRVVDRYVVSAAVDGMALRIELDVGAAVERGQTLVELSPLGSAALDPRSRADAEVRVEVARAALREAGENTRAAEADAAYSARELKRIQELHRNGSASGEELSRAEAAARRTLAIHRSAEFAAEVARFEVEAALARLRSYTPAAGSGEPYEKVSIEAPVSGRVLKVFHESAGVVRAGDPLLEIGDPRSLEVEVDVLSADAVKIAPGTGVLFERWGGDAELEGIVRVVEPAGFTKVSALGVEEQRVLVICDITSPPEQWDRLGDGYRVEARFILWEADEVLQIPSSATFRHGDGWAAFVFDGERELVVLRPLRIGHRSGLSVEILDGLAAGDVVVTHPPKDLRDGGPARAREEG